MSAAVLTLAPPIRQDHDPTKDKTYREARTGRAVVDFLAFLELGGLAARTLDQYERDLSRLPLMFPSLELDEVDDGHLAQVIRSFPEASRRVRRAPYDRFFKWARGTRRIPENPMELLPRQRRKPQKYLDTFTPAEAAALCSLPGIDGVLCTILLEAGLRKAEARNLRVGHTQLDRGRVIVFSGKGDRDRVIPMSGLLRQRLADHLLTDPLRPDEYWWYSTKANAVSSRRHHEKPVGEGTFVRWWAGDDRNPGVIRKAGLDRYLKPHATRHTFATELRKRGLPLEDIQVLLGHASIATTADVYVHSSVEEIAARMALIEAGE